MNARRASHFMSPRLHPNVIAGVFEASKPEQILWDELQFVMVMKELREKARRYIDKVEA